MSEPNKDFEAYMEKVLDKLEQHELAGYDAHLTTWEAGQEALLAKGKRVNMASKGNAFWGGWNIETTNCTVIFDEDLK